MSASKGATAPIVGNLRPAWAKGIWEEIEFRSRESPNAEEIRRLVALSGDPLDKRLLAFADKRGLWISGPNWRDRVIQRAALEHPSLREPKRKGRPAKATIGPLAAALGVVESNQDAGLIRQIDALNEARRKAGQKHISDRQFAAVLAEKVAPPLDQATWANRLSAARKAMGKPTRKKTKISR